MLFTRLFFFFVGFFVFVVFFFFILVTVWLVEISPTCEKPLLLYFDLNLQLLFVGKKKNIEQNSKNS